MSLSPFSTDSHPDFYSTPFLFIAPTHLTIQIHSCEDPNNCSGQGQHFTVNLGFNMKITE